MAAEDVVGGAISGGIATGGNPWGIAAGAVMGLISGNAADKAASASAAAAAETKRQYQAIAAQVETQGKFASAFKMEELNSMISNVNASVSSSGITFSSGSADNARLMARKEASRQLSMIKLNTATRASQARATGNAGVAQQNANAAASRANRTAGMVSNIATAYIGSKS